MTGALADSVDAIPEPEASPTGSDHRVLRFSGRAMASPLALTFVADETKAGRAAAAAAWSAVRDEFAASEEALSRFRETSEVTALNRASLQGASLTVGRRLARAVSATDRAHRLTGGRFDPRTVGLLDAWGYQGASLGAAIPATALGAAGPIAQRIDRERILLPSPIDLGGIGKGLAVRWAASRVANLGAARFLIDAGGDIVARGPGPDGTAWMVGVEDPDGGADPRAVIAIRDGAIATSSIRRLRWVVDGRTRHHLVDPSTGEPADSGLVSVTVAATDPAWAEVWSKTLFITGRSGIAAEARARGLAAWWVAEDGSLEMTPAARACTVWVAGEA
ncbi:MAG: FAD:protein FMN transferase [Chloroflexota bacterium]|jgi:thiamine biosynthesis lipoprotein|nr:FAD:protein FMN transferase [Chloroflexota bacterium]